jgi:predicted O-linked N-acetylglucosamine transferase (SPINDLY family)
MNFGERAAESAGPPADPNERYKQAVGHQQAGRWREAEAGYRQVIALAPGHWAAHGNLGVVLSAQGQIEAAVASLRRAIELNADYALAYNNLGVALRRLGRQSEAVDSFRNAVRLQPEWPEGLANLGGTLAALGRNDEAELICRRAIALKPEHGPAHINLAMALRGRGRLGEGIEACRRGVELAPSNPEGHNNLGGLLQGMGRLGEAVAAYRQALLLAPRYAVAHNNLGAALQAQGHFTEAIASYRQAIAGKPDYAEAYNNLGVAQTQSGETAAAIASCRRAIQLRPDFADAHSNMLYAMQYDPAANSASLLEAHRGYDRQFGVPAALCGAAHTNDRAVDRRLRVGYVSPDLGQHPAGYLTLPVFAAHDHAQFDVFVYSDRLNEDDLTRRLRALVSTWRETAGLNHAALADCIRADAIDILVDLSGHMGSNRLPMFARRPAPAQASWAGYVGTTGLSAIDYLIADAHVIPVGSEAGHAERIVRLPDGYLCFAPPDFDVPSGPPPAPTRGHITFGCLNNLAKLNRDVAALWARVLARVPAARLVLKTSALGDAAIRERCRAMFTQAGVAPERLELLGSSPRPQALAYYNEIDIALDPFPYTGSTTTFESLWMGVPVITLVGERFAARQSYTHLLNAGYGEFAAMTEDDYVDRAATLAGDLPRLAALRRDMRARVIASPLCDGARFTRGLVAAYRAMWADYCAAQPPAA